jgi:3-hydroxyisobutyrate dehydrogenase-like beta-hydroxyacid dehydrogenase
MKVGFIGLGAMGRPMASNLLKAGHELIVYNRTSSRAAELARAGAKISDTPAIAAEIVITMLADDHAVEDVVFDRLLISLPPGSVHVSMSTISVALSQRMAEAHKQKGQQYVSAPVFGRPEAAEAATLFVVAAGPAEAIRRCQPLFDVLGQKTFMLGEDAASANVVKVTGNFLIASTLECFGEAFALARKHGLDPQQYLEVLTGTLFSAPYQKNYGAIIAQEKYEPAGFRLALGLKDVRLVLAAAESARVPMPVASVLRDQYLGALARGWEDSDWSAIARLAADHAGLKPQS